MILASLRPSRGAGRKYHAAPVFGCPNAKCCPLRKRTMPHTFAALRGLCVVRIVYTSTCGSFETLVAFLGATAGVSRTCTRHSCSHTQTIRVLLCCSPFIWPCFAGPARRTLAPHGQEQRLYRCVKISGPASPFPPFPLRPRKFERVAPGYASRVWVGNGRFSRPWFHALWIQLDPASRLLCNMSTYCWPPQES